MAPSGHKWMLQQKAEEAKLQEEARDYIQLKLDRKTRCIPTLDEIVLSEGCWKYGGTFAMGDGEVHHRITIPHLGRVIHCHTKDLGKVLTRAHLKPKIREVNYGVIASNAEDGFMTRADPKKQLTTVPVWKAKGITKDPLRDLVKAKLKSGGYSFAIREAAHQLDECEYTFYAEEKSNNGWGPVSLAIRTQYREIVKSIVAVSDKIEFPCPDAG